MTIGKILDSARYQYPSAMAATKAGMQLAWVGGVFLMHQHYELAREEGSWTVSPIREAGHLRVPHGRDSSYL